MINRILMVGLLAGLCAGLFVATLQHFSATRMILIAETFETGDKAASPTDAHAGHTAEPAHEAAEWKPENGMQRTLITALMTTGTAISFAMMLLAALLFSGETITPKRALAFGGAAFLAFGLAPAAGLAPELPGSASASLAMRQAWWLATVLCSLGAIWMIARARASWMILLAIALLLVPHLIGAPHPAESESKVPAELAARFASLSLTLQAVLWMATGYITGYLWQRFSPPSSQPA